jgi:hypothetical protein
MREGNFNVLIDTIKELRKYKKVLLLTCSNRGQEVSETQLPKSSILAKIIHQNLEGSDLLDVTKLKIYPCEGNVSRMEGNVCGVKEALLEDEEKIHQVIIDVGLQYIIPMMNFGWLVKNYLNQIVLCSLLL